MAPSVPPPWSMAYAQGEGWVVPAFGKGIFRKIWIATEAAVRTETIHPDLHSAVDRFTLLVLHAWQSPPRVRVTSTRTHHENHWASTEHDMLSYLVNQHAADR